MKLREHVEAAYAEANEKKDCDDPEYHVAQFMRACLLAWDCGMMSMGRWHRRMREQEANDEVAS